MTRRGRSVDSVDNVATYSHVTIDAEDTTRHEAAHTRRPPPRVPTRHGCPPEQPTS
jgi:hypothetical protein